MQIVKLTALTGLFAVLLSFLLELYFGFTAKPYMFGYPTKKWPILISLTVMWAMSFKVAYYLLWQRHTFYRGTH